MTSQRLAWKRVASIVGFGFFVLASLGCGETSSGGSEDVAGDISTPEDAATGGDVSGELDVDGGVVDGETGSDAVAPTDPCDPANAYPEIVDGVSSLSLGSAVPSPLVVHGLNAFSVIVDEGGRTYGAAGCHGEGRVAAFGHAAFIHPPLEATDDAPQLVRNMVSWVANREGAVIAIAPGLAEIQSDLAGAGFDVVTVAPEAVLLEDAYVMDAAADLSEAGEEALRTFVDNGGGLLAAGNAWWWSYDHEDVVHAYPANRLFNEAGITWTSLSDVQAGDEVLPPGGHSPVVHAWTALEALRLHVLGEAVLAEGLLSKAVTTVSVALHGLSLSFEAYFSKALEMAETVGPVIPSDASPVVPAEHLIEGLIVILDHKRNQELPAAEMYVHPGAGDFPGSVPADAESVTVTRTVNGNYAGRPPQYAYSNPLSPEWTSLGVYAAPGALIEVVVDESFAGEGLSVAIGAHSDLLWSVDTWRRFPAMVRVDALDAPVTQSANALGGPVYLRVPVGSELGDVEVTVSGGVPMARYERGVTTLEEWALEAVKPAPWAEIGSEKFIVTVPLAVAASVVDPGPVSALWDDVMDASADLAAFPRERERAERIVFDRQISLGWLHSGYPAMGHAEPTASEAVDVATLLETGSWGPVHELGHNHQWVDTVLPGTTETTVNLWSVYVHEEVFGIPRDLAHPALEAASVEERMLGYLGKGAPFEEWSVWTALDSYLQVQVAFGWEPFKTVHAAYQVIPQGEAPTGDQGRIDQWVTRFSEATGHDLGPFYVHWGLPVGREALLEANQWPVWLEDPLRALLPYAVVMGTPSIEAGEAGLLASFEVLDPGAPDASYALHWGDSGTMEDGLTGELSLGDLSIGSQAIPVSGLPMGQQIVVQIAATAGEEVYWSPVSEPFTLSP